MMDERVHTLKKMGLFSRKVEYKYNYQRKKANTLWNVQCFDYSYHIVILKLDIRFYFFKENLILTYDDTSK